MAQHTVNWPLRAPERQKKCIQTTEKILRKKVGENNSGERNLKLRREKGKG
jgi:hypothetical protein